VDHVMPHDQLLPILCAIAWGEEVVKPPVDLRAKFMAKMRSSSADNVGTVSTDVGWDSLSKSPGATDHPKDHIMFETPGAPAGSVRSQITQHQRSHSGVISLMGV